MAELPDAARSWVAAHAPVEVARITAVPGGYTNTKWLVQLREGDPLVLRWSDPTTWGETGREHVRRESLALGLLADWELPVPRLVAADLDGDVAGGPAALMTWLPGASRLDPLGPDAVSALAALAVTVHQQPVSPTRRPPVFAYRGESEPQVPSWARWPGLWYRAIKIKSPGSPPTPYGLLHRDFHLSNVLWQGDRLTGLIDWAETSWGPADFDVAHACSDFAMLHTVADALAFRTAYTRQGGRLDPDSAAARYWQVSDILGFLPDPAHILAAVGAGRPDLTADDVRFGLEDLLAESLS